MPRPKTEPQKRTIARRSKAIEPNAKNFLAAIFEADMAARDAEHALVHHTDPKTLGTLLLSAVRDTYTLDDDDLMTLRLRRLADLCAQVPGADSADALINILNNENPSVRVAAGEALIERGYERYADVAHAVERALERKLDGPALWELPLVLAELAEPSTLFLVRRFLEHENPEVIASAIEALVHLREPNAIRLLEPLVNDEREVLLDAPDGDTPVTLGELAAEAVHELKLAKNER